MPGDHEKTCRKLSGRMANKTLVACRFGTVAFSYAGREKARRIGLSLWCEGAGV